MYMLRGGYVKENKTGISSFPASQKSAGFGTHAPQFSGGSYS